MILTRQQISLKYDLNIYRHQDEINGLYQMQFRDMEEERRDLELKRQGIKKIIFE